MSREIKFKAKSLDTNEWVYGTYVYTNDNKNNPFNVKHIKETHNICCYSNGDWNMGGWDFVEIDKTTLGQFTGLKDKNGNEIYEGDIIRTPYLDPIFGDIVNDVFENAIVEFNNGSFIVKYSDKNIYLFDLLKYIEIIGNIHDNPELLKDF